MPVASLPNPATRRPARRRVLGAVAAGLALAAIQPAAAQDTPDEPAKGEAGKGETELARLLEGREAGEPVSCISSRPQQRIRTIDGTAYVFGQGSTLYVQRTARPQDIDRRNAILSQSFSGGQLCRSDVVSTFDPIQGFFTGGVIFEDFVPYTRQRAPSREKER